MIVAGPDGKMDPKAAQHYIDNHSLSLLDDDVDAAMALGDPPTIKRALAFRDGYYNAERRLGPRAA